MEIRSEMIYRTGAQTMPHLTCTTISSADLAHYGVSRAKDWVSVDCGTRQVKCEEIWKFFLNTVQRQHITVLLLNYSNESLSIDNFKIRILL